MIDFNKIILEAKNSGLSFDEIADHLSKALNTVQEEESKNLNKNKAKEYLVIASDAISEAIALIYGKDEKITDVLSKIFSVENLEEIIFDSKEALEFFDRAITHITSVPDSKEHKIADSIIADFLKSI